jgi:hypothetical protein
MRTSNAVLQQLEALTGEAIAVVRQLLRDPNTPQSVRLRAAKLILTTAMESGGDDEPVSKISGLHLVPRTRGSKPDRVA